MSLRNNNRVQRVPERERELEGTTTQVDGHAEPDHEWEPARGQ